MPIIFSFCTSYFCSLTLVYLPQAEKEAAKPSKITNG